MSSADRKTNGNKPFTYSLSYVFLMLAVCYLFANIWVVGSCKLKYLENKAAPVCSAAEVFAPLRPVVPAIFRPVDVIQARGNPERAKLVIAVYGFAWGSFLIFATLLIAIGEIRCRLISDEEINIAVAFRARNASDNRHNKRINDQEFLGSKLLLLSMAFAFIASYFGFYRFDEWSFFSNMVQDRDRDLYYTAACLFSILLFESFFLTTWILSRVSRKSVPNAGDNV